MSFLCRNCQLAQRARIGNTPPKQQSLGDPASIHFINNSLIRSVIRHKRTHSREDGGEGALNLSGEEEEDFSGEDHLGSLEESSPSSEHAYITGSLNSMVGDHTSHGVPATMAPSQGYNSLQTLSMPMTISQPAAINATGMM
jgi:transcription factor STE12